MPCGHHPEALNYNIGHDLPVPLKLQFKPNSKNSYLNFKMENVRDQFFHTKQPIHFVSTKKICGELFKQN